MPPEIAKLLPLGGLLIASFLLADYSKPELPLPQIEHRVELGRVRKLDAFKLPTGLPDPFSMRRTVLSRARADHAEQKTGPVSKKINLDGIFWSEDSALVSLNGMLLARGEFLDGLKVEDIRPDRVILKLGGRRIVRRLADTGEKK